MQAVSPGRNSANAFNSANQAAIIRRSWCSKESQIQMQLHFTGPCTKFSLRVPSPNMAPSSTPNDTLLPADAQDTISSVAWSPTANYLAAASWDGKVRVYDIATDGSRARRIEERQVGGSAPVLSCDWLKVGSLPPFLFAEGT